MQNKTNNKPEHQCIVGAVQIAVFQNEVSMNGKAVPVKSINISKRYTKNGSDWNTTNNFQASDLFKLQIALNKTIDYLFLHQNSGAGNYFEDNEPEIL